MADVGLAMERAENKAETMHAAPAPSTSCSSRARSRTCTDNGKSIDGSSRGISAKGEWTASSAQMKAELGAAPRPPTRSRAGARAGAETVIVRILGKGQYRLGEADYSALNAIDDRVQAAAEASDDAGIPRRPDRAGRRASCASARRSTPTSSRAPTPIVPGHGTTLDDARELLSSEGLIPD